MATVRARLRKKLQSFNSSSRSFRSQRRVRRCYLRIREFSPESQTVASFRTGACKGTVEVAAKRATNCSRRCRLSRDSRISLSLSLFLSARVGFGLRVFASGSRKGSCRRSTAVQDSSHGVLFRARDALAARSMHALSPARTGCGTDGRCPFPSVFQLSPLTHRRLPGISRYSIRVGFFVFGCVCTRSQSNLASGPYIWNVAAATTA